MAPAILVISLLFGASILFGLAQSFGLMTGTGQESISFEAYRNVFSGQGPAGREFWSSLGFSLWVATASTLLSAIGALTIAIWLSNRKGKSQQTDTLALNWNLAFPHLVWAIALLLFFSQSGLLARFAATLGLIQMPADFPILVKDRSGIGIILDYVTKEIPFLTLIVLAVLRSQAENLDIVAENLGASRWQRLWYITIPQVLPALMAGSLIVFGFVFSAYEVPAILGVRYPRMLPVLALDFFLNPDLNSRAEGMVISFVITLIVMIVAIISLRGEKEDTQE
ncbi:MAG: ABC transporter permease subunit [Anaerolineaceae bacterium]|nr:ABC transporter permease subunit [Anaerolineaceae bacterium]